MGERLAKAADHFFSKVKGAKRVESDGIVTWTVKPGQIRKAMKNDPIWQAMERVREQLTPCWKCSNDWPCGGCDAETGPAGTVARTFHDASGACQNCKSITTKRQLGFLRKRHEKNDRAIEGIFNAPRKNHVI